MVVELKLKPLDRTIDEFLDREMEEFSRRVKQHIKGLVELKVNQLLKEIDREIENNKPENDWEWSEYVEGLKFAKTLIKKAFSGVINND